MADFVISFIRGARGTDLLRRLQRPYADAAPNGRGFDYPWGAVAVLEDPVAERRNVRTAGTSVIGWVGEFYLKDLEAAVAEAIRSLNPETPGAPVDLPRVLTEQANGAFAAFGVSPGGAWIVTDPMASVQVYAGRDSRGQVEVVGTHPDVVAACLEKPAAIDAGSVADFLNTGTPCCPYTMYQGVTEVSPGTAVVWAFESGAVQGEGRARQTAERVYWRPPAEESGTVDAAELAEQFVVRWRAAMALRSRGELLGVELSGGLDSRIVISCLAPETRALGLTLCDGMNREARVAREVARCYGREWMPLERDPEYLARTFLTATRFTGCEGEWHHGHAVGFADKVRSLGVTSLFTGLLMDNNFKGYYADDVVRVGRWRGMLPAEYRIVPRDYAGQVSEFCRTHLTRGMVDGIVERRRAFVRDHFAMRRSSPSEWLDGYPYSQASDNTGWTIERRLMPMRLPVMDRSMLDLAFRVPMTAKAGARFFERAAVPLLGAGRAIPSANDGVRPGSSHLSRLVQRAGRKVQNTGRAWAGRLGMRLEVPHSWHDYDRYWLESREMAALKEKYGPRLQEFENNVFAVGTAQLLQRGDLPWRTKYRFLQLAAWRALVDEYRN